MKSLTPRLGKKKLVFIALVVALIIGERVLREVGAHDAIANALLAGGMRVPPVRALALMGGLLTARVLLFVALPPILGVITARFFLRLGRDATAAK